MADNLTAPASGSVLAADDIGSVFYPRAKVVWGADGSANDASAAAPLPVSSPVILRATASPTVSTSAYAVDDVVGAKMTFSSVSRVANGTGLVQSALLQCKSSQTAAIDLILFHSDPSNSTFTDNAALAVDGADFDKIIGVAHLNDWTDLGTPSVAQAINLAMPFDLASGSDIYGVLVTRTAMTLASTSDVTAVLTTLPD